MKTDERENKQHHRTKGSMVEIAKRLGLVHINMSSVGFKGVFCTCFFFEYKG